MTWPGLTQDVEARLMIFHLLVISNDKEGEQEIWNAPTGWFEIVKAINKSATSIQDLFHNTWLAGYPQPQFIVFDNGIMVGFKREFKQICDNHGIKAKPTTSHNQHNTSKCNH
jgi:hypothetical protein